MVVLIVMLALLLTIVIWTIWNGISPMPTAPKVKALLVEMLPEIREGKVYELGCGWGTLIAVLTSKYPDLDIVGYETSPVPWFISRLRFYCSTRVAIKRENFFDKDLSEARLVVCYLYPGAMEKLKLKWDKELRPGTWVLSHTFAVPGWKPEKVIVTEDLYKTPIYLYCV